MRVSTHSRPKAAEYIGAYTNKFAQFQHTAARRRLSIGKLSNRRTFRVSTHSRPKAAGHKSKMPSALREFQHTAARRRLFAVKTFRLLNLRFNTQPPEGGCSDVIGFYSVVRVSTHSRPKAAVVCRCVYNTTVSVSTHSRPKAAGPLKRPNAEVIRFNTQPPEGG